jgi:biotin carboxylase
VQLVDCVDNLQQAYEEAIQYSKEAQVLLEEVLCGPEVSTESVVYQGKIHTFALADRNYVNAQKFKPFFVEDGINYPSELSIELQGEIYKLVEKTINALDIEFGAAKGDIIVDKGIPKIIEMAARTSGGWFGAGSIPAATGCNMLKPLLQMSVGDVPDLKALESIRNLGCAQRYIIPTNNGVVTGASGCEEALKMPGVVMSELFLPAIGATINTATSHADRFGQIICTAETRSAAIKCCEAAISKIKITTKQEFIDD